MKLARLVEVGQKLLAGIAFILVVFVLLMGCTRQYRRLSSDHDEEPARLHRSLSENDTLSNLLCTQQLVHVDETVENIVRRVNVSNDYVSRVRLSINFTDDDLPDDAERRSPVTWHWGLGGRGRTMLLFPYDNHSLSLTTLNYGMHLVSVSLNSSRSQNDSFSDTCLTQSLSKLLQQVRLRITNPGGSDNDKRDVICKERFSDSPSFLGTHIPGYSIFELQASTYYECWNLNNIKTCVEDNCVENRSFRIDCTIVNISFGITYVLLFLAVSYELWRIYSKTYNYQDEELREDVKILQINLIPPVLLLLGPNMDLQQARLHKLIHVISWIVVYSIPFIISFVAFLCYVTAVEEYAYRSNQRGGMYKHTKAWVLDFGLANIFYLGGTIVFLVFVCKYRIENEDQHIERPYDWSTKKRRLLVYIPVALLCFCRFSASAMLFIEILVLTVIGISINITYGSPVWLTVIVGVLVLISNIVQYFDSYQHLFSSIYSVGTKVDREGTSQNKIFKQTNDGSPQMQFKIRYNILKDIIRKWLPFGAHLLNTLKHIILGLGLLAILAVAVVYIDQITHISSLGEYVITLFPLLIAAAAKLKGIPLTAGGKAKNSAQDKLFKLEEDLRQFAQTGIFPLPEASSCCPSCSWCPSWIPCCTREGDRQEPDQDTAATGTHPQNSQSVTEASGEIASSSVSVSIPSLELPLPPSI